MVHAQTFHFDHHVPYMIGISYLLASEGEGSQPGDDMRDARYRVVVSRGVECRLHPVHPSTPLWMLHRAVVLYRVCHDQPPVPSNPLSTRNTALRCR